jgi:hypothetical protein
MTMMRKLMVPALLALTCLGNPANAAAQQLDTHFSCSETRNEDGEKVLYADSGEIHLDGTAIKGFHWESSLFRTSHGFDCSIDDSDGLQAEASNETGKDGWRISLLDGRAARERRGYNFERGYNCSIRLTRSGDMLNVKPTCPALCGSRLNFSELSVSLKTGVCRYEE